MSFFSTFFFWAWYCLEFVDEWAFNFISQKLREENVVGKIIFPKSQSCTLAEARWEKLNIFSNLNQVLRWLDFNSSWYRTYILINININIHCKSFPVYYVLIVLQWMQALGSWGLKICFLLDLSVTKSYFKTDFKNLWNTYATYILHTYIIKLIRLM